jgi:hypothetical protein
VCNECEWAQWMQLCNECGRRVQRMQNGVQRMRLCNECEQGGCNKCGRQQMPKKDAMNAITGATNAEPSATNVIARQTQLREQRMLDQGCANCASGCCGSATFGISHLGLCSHIPYLGTRSHLYIHIIHTTIIYFPPPAEVSWTSPARRAGDSNMKWRRQGVLCGAHNLLENGRGSTKRAKRVY